MHTPYSTGGKSFRGITPDIDVVLFTEGIHLPLGIQHVSLPEVCNLLTVLLNKSLNLGLEAFDGDVLYLLCLFRQPVLPLCLDARR